MPNGFIFQLSGSLLPMKRDSGLKTINLLFFLRFSLRVFAHFLVGCAVLSTVAFAQGRPVNIPLENEWVPAKPKAEPTTAQQDPASLPPPGQGTGTDNQKVPAGDSVVTSIANTIVGAGDQVLITVFGQPDMSAEVTVNDNRQVTLPLIGNMQVGGLTPQAIERQVAQRLKDGEYLHNPAVSVQVRQFRSQVMSVLGEVQRPGRFPISGRMTILDALATAGGLTPRADQSAVLIRKVVGKDGQIQKKETAFRLDQISDLSKNELDIELRNDDVVFVAPQRLFYVFGEVRRPGAYPMEVDLNVMRVLSISGGVTDRGSLRRIRIHRKGANQTTHEISPTLNDLIVTGDVIYVDERLF